MNVARSHEMKVLVAVGVAGGRTWADVRQRVALTDREFAAVARSLVVRGAIVRDGWGPNATLRRNLRAWHR